MTSQFLKNALSIFVFTLVSFSSFAQSVGVSGLAITPDPDALLELRATDKGVLLPRMNSTQRNNYTTTANSGGGLGASEAGMTIFNTSTNLYNYWDGSAWVVIQTVGGTTGAYIDNQNALDQAADFRISGNGTMNGALGVGTQAALGTSRVIVHDASGTAGELQLLVRDNASLPILSVQDIGRVGIGTSAPAASLEIRGVASSPMFSQRITKNSNIASELTGIGFGSQQSSSVVKSGIVHERISANGTGKLHFLNDNSVDANDVATTETRMTIDQNGNVGIGITSPVNGMHVFTDEGTGLGYLGVGLGGGASGNSKIEIRGGSTPYLDFSNDAGIDYDGRLRLLSNDQLIFEGASLGIGIAPLEALHVSGNTRISSLGGSGNSVVTSNNNGVLGNTALTGNVNDVYNGAGAFVPATSLTVTPDNLGNHVATQTVDLSTNNQFLNLDGANGNVFELRPGQNISDGVVIRAITNPTGSGTIFGVESSGSATRFGVTQDQGTFARDGFWAGTYDNGSITRAVGMTYSGTEMQLYAGSAERIRIQSDGDVGIGTTTPGYKLHVNGRLRTTGINETSDIRLKKNIVPIESALDKVAQMNGVTYNWKTKVYPDHGLSDDLQHGLIAQELEKIIPELVLTDSEGFKSIEYTHLVPVLIEAIKELKSTNEIQSELLNVQNTQINNLTKLAETNNKTVNELLGELKRYSISE